MFRSIKNGWTLTKFSWGVIRKDFSLLMIPLISGLIIILLSISFFIPLYPLFEESFGESSANESFNPLIILLIFIFYILSYTVGIYFNVVLVSIVLKKFDGVKMTFSEGLTEANRRFGAIFGYAVIAATVGLVLNMLSNMARNNDNKVLALFGQIAIGFVGVAWNIATFLVVPVMVVKNTGPVASIKESASLLKKTWGEQVTSTFSTGIIIFLLSLPFLIIGGLLFGSGLNKEVGDAIGNGTAELILGGGIIFVTILLMSLISSAMETVLRAVIYKYAQDGTVVQGLDQNTVNLAFQSKTK